MTAANLRGGAKPSLNDALGWIGSRVDDSSGNPVGRLEDVWIDPGTGAPRWLLVHKGGPGERSTLVPFGDAATGAGRLWIPYERDVVIGAPDVDPGAPLTQQAEADLRRHYAMYATQAERPATAPLGGSPAHPSPAASFTPAAQSAFGAQPSVARTPAGAGPSAGAPPLAPPPAPGPPPEPGYPQVPAAGWSAPRAAGPTPLRPVPSPASASPVNGEGAPAGPEAAPGAPGAVGGGAPSEQRAEAARHAAAAIPPLEGRGPVRIEIRIEGDLRISGELTGLRVSERTERG